MTAHRLPHLRGRGPTVPETRYSFLGESMPDELAAKFPDRIAIFDGLYGTHVVRRRTNRLVPLDHDARVAMRGAA